MGENRQAFNENDTAGSEYVLSERMGVSENVEVQDGEFDSNNAWHSTPRAYRTSASLYKQEQGKAMYVRRTIVCGILIGFSLLYGIIYLAQSSQAVSLAGKLKRVETKNVQLAKENDQLLVQIAMQQDEISILKRAAQDLNMVAPNEKEVITLTAIDTRPFGENVDIDDVLYAMYEQRNKQTQAQ